MPLDPTIEQIAVALFSHHRWYLHGADIELTERQWENGHVTEQVKDQWRSMAVAATAAVSEALSPSDAPEVAA
jgi:hypothetical protein